MTEHLVPNELLAAVDDSLAPERAEHMRACPTCRDALALLRSTLVSVQRADVPEPSPLFWDHLSARVRAATSAEPVPETRPWWSSVWRPVAAVSAIVAVATLVVSLRTAPMTTAGEGVPLADRVQAAPLTDDGGWGAMEQMASTLSTDDVHLVVAAAPEYAPMVSELNAREREAFVKLLGSELIGEQK